MLRQLTLASFVRWLPEASAVALVGALAPACASTSEPMSAAQRELLAQDVRDAITAARPCAVEPALRQTLIDAGREPDDADAILAILRIALRRIEFALT